MCVYLQIKITQTVHLGVGQDERRIIPVHAFLSISGGEKLCRIPDEDSHVVSDRSVEGREYCVGR